MAKFLASEIPSIDTFIRVIVADCAKHGQQGQDIVSEGAAPAISRDFSMRSVRSFDKDAMKYFSGCRSADLGKPIPLHDIDNVAKGSSPSPSHTFGKGISFASPDQDSSGRVDEKRIRPTTTGQKIKRRNPNNIPRPPQDTAERKNAGVEKSTRTGGW
ncbi:MAG: hypothetical protein AAF982_12870 [Pseudomonadota bacterium]